MAPISAILLLVALVASFLCAQKAALLVFRLSQRLPEGHIANKSVPFVDFQNLPLINNPLYDKVARKFHSRKQAEELQRAMPEAIRLLCISLESGSSLEMGLRYAANNSSEPLAGELRRTVWDLEAGQGFDESLDNLRQRTGSSEIAFLAVAMEIQHQSGGNLGPILDNLAALLKQTSELKADLRTKTAQGRLSSRIVAIMPFLLVGVLSMFSPGYLVSFFSSALGVCLLILALIFEAVGVVLVRRCLTVDFTADFEEAV